MSFNSHEYIQANSQSNLVLGIGYPRTLGGQKVMAVKSITLKVMCLKGLYHKIFEVGFFIKQPLLVPLEVP